MKTFALVSTRGGERLVEVRLIGPIHGTTEESDLLTAIEVETGKTITVERKKLVYGKQQPTANPS